MPSAPSNLLYVPDRDAWRAWLEANHATETEVWLVYYKQHTGRPRVPYDDAVGEALCFGWIDSIVRKLDEERFAQKFTPRADAGRWSPSNLERMERLIASGRMTPAGLAKFQPRPQEARWDTTQPLPAFVEEGLRAHPAAWERFQKLPPSHKREYVRWIVEAKKEETRAKRLGEAIGRLEQGETLGLK